MKDCKQCVFDGECVTTPDVCKGFVQVDHYRKLGEELSGKKDDQGKTDWYALPLELLEPLAELMLAGAIREHCKGE